MSAQKNPYLAALEWHLDIGADEALSDHPVDRTVSTAQVLKSLASNDAPVTTLYQAGPPSQSRTVPILPPSGMESGGELLGTAQAKTRVR